jgi:tetratricopeptide (TPR) repeat protein
MDAGGGMTIKSAVVYRIFFLCFGFLVCSQSSAEPTDYSCGSIKNAYGPFDYRSGGIGLKEVEGNHLTPEVVNLVRGKTGYIGGDLDYTLRAYPNHHVALMAMVRLGEKEKTSKPIGANYVVECYFKRALIFRSDDGVVRTIYASYLYKAGKKAEALNQLNQAVQLGEDSPNTNYNIGLIYFDLKEYEKALYFAQRAYGSGFPLPGLRDKLKKAGKWKEPVARIENGGAQVTDSGN